MTLSAKRAVVLATLLGLSIVLSSCHGYYRYKHGYHGHYHGKSYSYGHKYKHYGYRKRGFRYRH